VVLSKSFLVDANYLTPSPLHSYHNNGFDTVMAVENDPDAVRTLKENNPWVKVYDGCIKKFLHDYDTLACALGRIDHIHYSSPCQDFSSANRVAANQSVVTCPRERADLSLLLIDFIRKTSCDTAVFENVVGIWRPNNAHYLLNMTKEIMKLGYQVRCTVLHACDYGDPQRRPRVFMFVAKNNVPLPSVPPVTHGTRPLWPYVTVKCALSQVENDNSLPNMEGRATNLKPGQHGHICLDGNDVAPTLRAAAVTPFHFSGDRLLYVREVATLQSFPVRYKFYGGITSQYRQAGNAVPVETSTAVAQSIRQVLLYEYE
jgi:DNA (cytosine-5)-methyltransferase 1